MDPQRARQLVARERQQIESALAGHSGDADALAELESQQAGETDAGDELTTKMTDNALETDLRERLVAVERAEARIAAGTFGRSIESGAAIPDERLEVYPLAERTVEEQRLIEQG